MRKNVRRVVSLTLTVILMLTILAPAISSAAPGNGRAQLSKHDRVLLAEARANGDDTVTLLVAAKDGSNASVASAVSALGATVKYGATSSDTCASMSQSIKSRRSPESRTSKR